MWSALDLSIPLGDNLEASIGAWYTSAFNDGENELDVMLRIIIVNIRITLMNCYLGVHKISVPSNMVKVPVRVDNVLDVLESARHIVYKVFTFT